MGHQTRVSLDIPHEIVTTRVLEAPRELVWRAFTDIAHIGQWWGPVGFTTTTHEVDLRPGGVWRHTLHGPDGRDWPNRVLYTDLQPPALLAWAHDDDSGGEPWFHVRVSLQALGERTLLTLRHTFPSAAARDANIARSGGVQGAIDTTNRLAGHLVAMPQAQDFIVMRDFDAAPQSLWQAWTDPQQLARWWGPAAFTNTVCEVDLRVGGAWRITMSGPHPGPGISHYPVKGVFLEIAAPLRLVMTQDCAEHPGAWHDQVKPGRAADDTNPAGTMLLTVVLQALADGRTRLTVRESMVSPEVLARLVAMGMQEGWTQSLDRLAALVTTAGGVAPVPED